MLELLKYKKQHKVQKLPKHEFETKKSVFLAWLDPGPDPVPEFGISAKSEIERSHSILFAKGRSPNSILSTIASKKIVSAKNIDNDGGRRKTEAAIFFRVRRSKRFRWKRFGRTPHWSDKKVLRNIVRKKKPLKKYIKTRQRFFIH